VGSNAGSKVTKSTEEGALPSKTEFSRLKFDTWVSQVSISTIFPATVVKDGYIDLDKSTGKELKMKTMDLMDPIRKTYGQQKIRGRCSRWEKRVRMRKPNATVSDELSVNGMKVFTENEREVFNIEMKGDY
jgi:hypothetical protein